ncbi:hypothetical protein QE152_g4874 [Popillia japonica]|uniref:Uncharacterized protein n=1 Tax=Popillia japonica TaxID=7064 RepID=A0AAW1N156_POPJA
MTYEKFHELLDILELKNETTRFRMAIQPEERLGVCLRFLASGNSFRSLTFNFRMGEKTKKKKDLDEIANPKNRKLIVFTEGQNVLIYSAQEKQWKPGKVVKLVSNVTYLVWSENKIKFVHASNIKESLLEEPTIDEVHEKFPYALRENDNRIIFQDKTEVGSGLENYAHQRKEMEIERNVRDETKERENSQGETKVQNP